MMTVERLLFHLHCLTLVELHSGIPRLKDLLPSTDFLPEAHFLCRSLFLELVFELSFLKNYLSFKNLKLRLTDIIHKRIEVSFQLLSIF